MTSTNTNTLEDEAHRLYLLIKNDRELYQSALLATETVMKVAHRGLLRYADEFPVVLSQGLLPQVALKLQQMRTDDGT